MVFTLVAQQLFTWATFIMYLGVFTCLADW